jgi:tRNA threonylcarbamoyladenosine biosynthesis protein TsaB
VTVLGIDTTSEFGSLALRTEGRTAAAREIHSSEGFAHLVFPALEELLRSAGVRLEEIDCYAAASGPGSFTGVRVGLAAVKGLAEALGKRAAGVSNLQALSVVGSGARRAVVLDARRGEVYGGVYDGGLRAVTPETVMTWEAWLETLGEGEYEFIGEGRWRERLAGTKFEAMKFVEAPRYLAGIVAECAERTAGGSDPAALDANYVRRSDAELYWRDSGSG